MRRMAALRTAVALAVVVQSYAQPPTSCSGSPNVLPVWTGTPSLVNSTANGLKMVASPENGTAPLIVVHLYGTDYEMGFAYGQLLREEISTLVPQVMSYMEAQVNQSLAWIAEPYRDAVAEWGLEWGLNLTYEATKPYAPAYWYDQLRGVSDGSGMDYMILARMTMIPELIKAQCSIVGAWGAASANTSNSGALVQLRALDWDTDGPFQQFPVLATWHPSSVAAGGNGGWAHSTMGWAGLLGAITGFSSSGVAISEKVWDAYTGSYNIFGYPFHFVLQDILRFDGDSDSAVARIATANRTCAIWIGIGDNGSPLVSPGSGSDDAGQSDDTQAVGAVVTSLSVSTAGAPLAATAVPPQFRLVSYSNQQVRIWSPRNFVPWPNHDAFADLLFVNKHVQPSTEPCMNDALRWLYGHIDARALYQYIAPLEQTGDMHIAVYDFANSLMYVSNASPGDGQGNGVVPAYSRPFLRFNMTQLWTQALPSGQH